VDLIKRLLRDRSIDVVVQTINSLRYVPKGAAKPLIEGAIGAYLGNEIVTASAQQSLQFDPEKPGGVTVKIDPAGLALLKQGREHFTGICFACHGADGKGMAAPDGQLIAPSLAGSPRVLGSPDALVRILLNGIVGEIDGKNYPGAMIPQRANDDLWLAQVATYIRNSFGNNVPAITPAEVARIRKAAGERPPYTLPELAPYLAIPRDRMSQWEFSASENSKEATRAVDGDLKTRWSTNKAREVGQWFQVDMKKPFRISRFVVDTTGSNGDFPKKFELRASKDGVTWSEPIASGDGKTIITLDFPNMKVAQYLRIVQNTKQGGFWSIHELGVYGTDAN
jgi:mono/diheme cytochrome c family protein